MSADAAAASLLQCDGMGGDMAVDLHVKHVLSGAETAAVYPHLAAGAGCGVQRVLAQQHARDGADDARHHGVLRQVEGHRDHGAAHRHVATRQGRRGRARAVAAVLSVTAALALSGSQETVAYLFVFRVVWQHGLFFRWEEICLLRHVPSGRDRAPRLEHGVSAAGGVELKDVLCDGALPLLVECETHPCAVGGEGGQRVDERPHARLCAYGQQPRARGAQGVHAHHLPERVAVGGDERSRGVGLDAAHTVYAVVGALAPCRRAVEDARCGVAVADGEAQRQFGLLVTHKREHVLRAGGQQRVAPQQRISPHPALHGHDGICRRVRRVAFGQDSRLVPWVDHLDAAHVPHTALAHSACIDILRLLFLQHVASPRRVRR